MLGSNNHGRCVRCRQWKEKHPDADCCNDCMGLLGAAYQRIDDTAERAKAQAYKFWVNGAACNHNGNHSETTSTT